MIKTFPPPSNANPLQILRMRDLCERLQLSPSHLFALIARGQFPKPFVLVPNGRAVGWLERDVVQWILSRKEEAEKEGV